MAALRCFRTSGVLGMAFVFALSAHAASDPQSASTAVQLSPTRSLSLKACGWEPEPLVVHHTGYIPVKLAFDHRGNLWTGYTKKSQQVVPRSTPELGALYNVVELSGNPTQCVVQMKLPTTESSPVAVLFSDKDDMLVVANDKLHIVDQNGFNERHLICSEPLTKPVIKSCNLLSERVSLLLSTGSLGPIAVILGSIQHRCRFSTPARIRQCQSIMFGFGRLLTMEGSSRLNMVQELRATGFRRGVTALRRQSSPLTTSSQRLRSCSNPKPLTSATTCSTIICRVSWSMIGPEPCFTASPDTTRSQCPPTVEWLFLRMGGVLLYYLTSRQEALAGSISAIMLLRGEWTSTTQQHGRASPRSSCPLRVKQNLRSLQTARR
jgi:hypothetical protein